MLATDAKSDATFLGLRVQFIQGFPKVPSTP